MTLNSDIILQFKENKYFVRFLCFAWICLSIYKWDDNPWFFLISTTVIIFLLLVTSEKSIQVKVDSLEITNQHWLPFLNKTRVFNYCEMRNIKYEAGKGASSEGSVFIVFIEMFFFQLLDVTNRYGRIEITESNNTTHYISIAGNKNDNLKLIEIVKKKINK